MSANRRRHEFRRCRRALHNCSEIVKIVAINRYYFEHPNPGGPGERYGELKKTSFLESGHYRTDRHLSVWTLPILVVDFIVQ